MSKEGLTKKPRFSVGDCVVAVGPSIAYCGHQGVVIEITELAGDLVYRYVVCFANGTTDTFFGFELQLV